MAARTRQIALALALGALGFGYGFAVGKWEVFPYAWLRAQHERLGALHGSKARELGWWETARGTPSSMDAALDDLRKIGYAEAYESALQKGGTIVRDAAKIAPGVNLYASAHDAYAALVDRDGGTLHAWSLSFAKVWPERWDPEGDPQQGWWRRVRLFEDGRLLAIYEGNGLVLLDRDSRLLWKLAGGYHHDLDVASDGSIWVLTREARVVASVNEEEPILEDGIARVSSEGVLLEEFSLLEAFQDSEYAPLLARMARAGDVFHTNTLEVFEGELDPVSTLFTKGRALVSVRELDVVALVDLASRRVVWAMSGPWRAQHEPVALDDGRLLVFDNQGEHGMSKVIELDPETQELLWAYRGTEENGFFSSLCGSNQRLANGNTLITESTAGRAFEVTRAGEIVWEFLSPHRGGPRGDQVAVLMEMVRLPESFPLAWCEPPQR